MEIAINGDDAKGAADIDIEGALLLPLVDQLAICAAGMEAQESSRRLRMTLRDAMTLEDV